VSALVWKASLHEERHFAFILGYSQMPS
jgi:hypothetical protein